MAQKFTITAELNLQTKNLSQVVNNLKQQFQGANLNIKIKDLAQAEASVRNISKGAKDAQGSFNSLGSSIASAAKRFSAITLATGTFVGLARAVKGAVSDAVEFEREMVKISQATGKTISQLQALRSEIGSVSSGFGVSSKELIEAARNLTQAGFAADKVTGALKLLAQTELAATFDSIHDTTEGVIAVLNQFGREAQRTGNEIGFLEKSLSAINQVSKEYAVESSDLITAIRTTGSAFETAGGSLDELIALFTSVRSTTRESAESIATGFRTIFTRTQRLDTINNLKKLGIELQDAEGKFVGPMEATKRLSIALSSIDPKDFRFNLIVEQLGGFRQVSKVIPLIQQFGVAQKALNVAQGSSGSLAKDAATAQQSLAVQIQKTREEFSRFIRDLTESKTFKDTAKFLLEMANAFIKVADVLKPLIPMMAGFAAMKVGQALLPGVKSLAGAAQKRHEGGKIHAFASGGLVPGSGNGDTVPAMLTPGEFVIKKSSVKKLGVDSLASANKYASGGIVQYYGTKTGAGAVTENDPTKRNKGKEFAKRYSAENSGYSLDKFKGASFKEGSKTLKAQQIISTEKRSGTKNRTFGAAFLKPEGKDEDISGHVNTADIIKQYFSANPNIPNAKSDGYKKAITSAYPTGLNFDIKTSSLKKEIEQDFKESLLGDIATTVDNNANKLLGNIPDLSGIGPGVSYDILKASNLDNVLGNVYEAVIKTASGRFTDSDTGPGNQPFDFPTGLGDAAKAFTGDLTNVMSDAKTTLSTQSITSLVEKVQNQVGFEEVSKLKDRIIEQAQGVVQDKESLAKHLINIGSKGSSLDTLKKDSIIVQALGQNPVNAENINGLFNSVGLKKISKTSYKYAMSDNKNKGGSIASLTDIPWMAGGGQASGSDTVPAMLTPGEFVINKKSAEKIGSSALNRMNKVGKFNTGGGVGRFGKISGATALGGAKVNPFQPYSAQAANANPPSKSSSNSAINEVSNTANELKDSLDKILEASNNTSSGMLLLGASVASVVSQMSGMDKEYADMITAFAGTFGTLHGIGQSLKNTGATLAAQVIVNKKHKKATQEDSQALIQHKVAVDKDSSKTDPSTDKTAKRFEQALGIAEGAITGFALASAAQAALAARDNAIAEKESKKLEKAMEGYTKDLTGEAQVRSHMTNTLMAAEKAQARTNAMSSKEAIGGGVAGGAIGGLIGGPVGAAIGSAIGTTVGAEFANAFDSAKVSKASEQLSTAFLTATAATFEFNKFMQKIDDKSSGQVNEQFSKLSGELAKAQGKLSEFDPNILDSGSETMKANFLKTTDTVDALRKNFDQLSGVITGRVVKAMQEAAKVGVVFDNKKIGKYVDDYTENLKKVSDAKYNPQIARAKGPGEKQALKDLGEGEVKLASAEFKKTLLESSIQILKQEKALIQERQAREQVIGSLVEENALKAGLERYNTAINKAADRSDQLDAAFSDSVQGLKSSIPSSKIFDMDFPNADDLGQALDKIREIGPLGEKLASNFSDLNKVTPVLDTVLTQLASKKFADIDITKDLDKIISESFGIDASGMVGKALKDMIQKAYTNQEGEGGAGTIDREKIKQQFEGFAEELKKSSSGILQAFEQTEQKQRMIADKLIQSEQRKLEIANEGVDSYSRMNDAISKALGKDVPLIQKNAMRFAKTMNLLGKSAGKSIPQIGKDLTNARKKLASGTLKPLDAAKVSNEAKNLEQALKNLSDQSNRTSDTLNELEKHKAAREQVQKNLTDYAFGSDEDRASLDNTAAATNRALQTGDINSVEGPMRKEVLNMLDTMGDFGKQAKKQLTANYFQSQGHPELAKAAMAETSTPEQQLINELQSIYAEEIMAQQERMKQENDNSQNQIVAYNEITAQLNGIRQQFEKQYADFVTKNEAASKAAGGGAEAPKLTVSTIDTKIKQMEESLKGLDVSITTFKDNINRLNEALTKFNEAKANGKAMGGLIYRADGGFTPKGTDTVPAMLTPGEFVMKKSAVDRIGADNLSRMNKGGKVQYKANGGLVQTQERMDKATNEEEKYSIARAYAIAQKNEIDLKTKQPGRLGRLRGKKAEADYSELKKLSLGVGNKSDEMSPYPETISLYDLVAPSPDAQLRIDKAFKTKEGFKGDNSIARELSDEDQARAAAFADASSGAFISLTRGLAKGMLGIPFGDFLPMFAKMKGYDPATVQWQGKSINEWSNATFYNVIKDHLGLPEDPSNDNAKWWEGTGKEIGKVLNPAEYVTGSAVAGVGSKIMSKIGTKGMLGGFLAKTVGKGSSVLSKLDEVVSKPFKKISEWVGSKFSKVKDKAVVNLFGKEALEKGAAEAGQFAGMKLGKKEAAELAAKQGGSASRLVVNALKVGNLALAPTAPEGAKKAPEDMPNVETKKPPQIEEPSDAIPEEVKPAELTKPTEATQTQEKKKRKRRNRGMNPNNMMAFNAMQNFGASWTQNAIAEAQSRHQQAQSDWFNTMNQGPFGYATGGPVYLSGGGQPKGTDTVPAMLTPGEFVMNKSAVDKHGIGMMQHLNSGGDVKYLAGGGMIPLGMGQWDYDLAREEHEKKKAAEAKQREKNAKTFAEKEKARAAKIAPTMDKITAEGREKRNYASQKSQAGKTLTMGPGGPPTFMGDSAKKLQGPELPIGQDRAVTPVELGSSKPATPVATSAGNATAQRTLSTRANRGSGNINTGSMANNAMVNAQAQQGPGSLNSLREIAQRRASEGKPPATPAITPPAAAVGAAGAAVAAMAAPAPVVGAAAAGDAGVAAAPEAPRRPSTQRGAGGPMRDRAIQANSAMKANRMGFQQMMMNRNRPRSFSQMMGGGGGGGMMNPNPMAQMQQQQQMQQVENGGGNATLTGGATEGQSEVKAAGGQGGGADMSSFAASVESLNKITETFSKFTETLTGIAAQFSNLSVTHNVTVAGAINVEGVDSGIISKTISTALTNMVASTVKTHLEDFAAKHITGNK